MDAVSVNSVKRRTLIHQPATQKAGQSTGALSNLKPIAKTLREITIQGNSSVISTKFRPPPHAHGLKRPMTYVPRIIIMTTVMIASPASYFSLTKAEMRPKKTMKAVMRKSEGE